MAVIEANSRYGWNGCLQFVKRVARAICRAVKKMVRNYMLLMNIWTILSIAKAYTPESLGTIQGWVVYSVMVLCFVVLALVEFSYGGPPSGNNQGIFHFA